MRATVKLINDLEFELQEVTRIEITFRRDKMYFRAYMESGQIRSWDYSEVKQIVVESPDGTKSWDLLRSEG